MAREIVASAAHTTDSNSGLLLVGGDGNPYKTIDLFCDITTTAGTSPTLDLTIQWSSDGGTTWFVADATPDAFAQQTGGATTVVKSFSVRANSYRVAWALGGTAPSFTFAIDEVAHRL